MKKAPGGGKQRVCYFYDQDIGNYYYGQGHPMKPHRIRMAHNLLLSYGLYRKMEIYVRVRPPRARDYFRSKRAVAVRLRRCARAASPANLWPPRDVGCASCPRSLSLRRMRVWTYCLDADGAGVRTADPQRPAPASFEELSKFHSEEYVRFLKMINPDNMAEHTKLMQRFNVGEDSPVFDGLYNFCQVRRSDGRGAGALQEKDGVHQEKETLGFQRACGGSSARAHHRRPPRSSPFPSPAPGSHVGGRGGALPPPPIPFPLRTPRR